MGPRLFRACPVVVLAGIASAQSTWHVDADAPGGDGTGWDSAFAFLQDALDAASPGDTILVAEGVYLPDRDAGTPGGTGNRNSTFSIDGILVGGYAGYDADDPSERDPNAFVTVLSGDLGANDAPDFANRTDNAYHVVTARRRLSTLDRGRHDQRRLRGSGRQRLAGRAGRRAWSSTTTSRSMFVDCIDSRTTPARIRAPASSLRSARRRRSSAAEFDRQRRRHRRRRREHVRRRRDGRRSPAS